MTLSVQQRSSNQQVEGTGADPLAARGGAAGLGDHAVQPLSRESWSTARSAIARAWPATNKKYALKRELSLMLLDDPDLRLRVAHVEDLLNIRLPPLARHHAPPLQAALADPTYSRLFSLNANVNEPDWGMQVLRLNFTELQKELGLQPSLASCSGNANGAHDHAATMTQQQQQQQARSDDAGAGAGLGNGAASGINRGMASGDRIAASNTFDSITEESLLAALSGSNSLAMSAGGLTLPSTTHASLNANAGVRNVTLAPSPTSQLQSPGSKPASAATGGAVGSDQQDLLSILSDTRQQQYNGLNRISSSSGFTASSMRTSSLSGPSPTTGCSTSGSLPMGLSTAQSFGNTHAQHQQQLQPWGSDGAASISSGPRLGTSSMQQLLMQQQKQQQQGSRSFSGLDSGQHEPMPAVGSYGASNPWSMGPGSLGIGSMLTNGLQGFSVGSAGASPTGMWGNGLMRGLSSSYHGQGSGMALGFGMLDASASGVHPRAAAGDNHGGLFDGNRGTGSGGGGGGSIVLSSSLPGLSLSFGPGWGFGGSAGGARNLTGTSPTTSNTHLDRRLMLSLADSVSGVMADGIDGSAAVDDSFFSLMSPLADIAGERKSLGGKGSSSGGVPKEVASCWPAGGGGGGGGGGVAPSDATSATSATGTTIASSAGPSEALSSMVLASEYTSWPSSSPEVSSMRSGDDTWPRLNTDVCKGPGGPSGGQGGETTSSTGLSPSISEEGEELGSQCANLDMETALEAIIGFEAAAMPSGRASAAGSGSCRGDAGGAGGDFHAQHQQALLQQVQQQGGNCTAGMIAAAAAAATAGRNTLGSVMSVPSTGPSVKSFAAVAVAGQRPVGQQTAGVTQTNGGQLRSAMAAAEMANTKHDHSVDTSADMLANAMGSAPGSGPNALLTGYAAIAARDPARAAAAVAAAVAAGSSQAAAGFGMPPHGTAVPIPQQHGAAGMAGIGAAARISVASSAPGRLPSTAHGLALAMSPGSKYDSKLFPKLAPRVREEIHQLVRTVPGLKLEDFDDGVLYQLTLKKGEDEAVNALRTLAGEDVTNIQHMAAYINHVIKNYHMTSPGSAQGGMGPSTPSLPSATVRANSTPVSSKAILQKLPLRVYKRLEEVIAKCSYMEWKHFDAGVIKVMAQLAEICEDDVFEELELLKSTDLSNVEYMPAYLNKRLNNRLWSRRKMQQQAAAVAGH